MNASHDHEHFMTLALAQADRAARAGEFPVGCVTAYDGRVIVESYRQNSTGSMGNELDHAEIVALRKLITYREPIDLAKVTLYSTMEPCLMCFSTLILSGIRTIVYGYEDAMGGGTRLVLKDLPPLYADMSVKIVPYILRDQCLSRFKQFFSNSENEYWKDSLLARYTMQQ